MISGRSVSVAIAVLLSVVLPGCGEDDSRASLPERDAVAADLQKIKSAAEAVRDAPTGRYVLVQSVQAQSEARTQVVQTRRGQYDEAAGLHQVEVTVPPSGGDPEIRLTFLNAGDVFLMKNPAFTARHGKTWTALPSDAVEQAVPGIGDTAPLPEPPGLGVLATAAAPGSVRTNQTATTYDIAVDMYESISLLANNASYVKVAELSGVTQDQLPSEFSGTVPATVVLTNKGIRSLIVDLSPIFARAAELTKQPSVASGEIEATLTFDPGASVDLSVPADSDIGPFQ